MEQKNVIKDKSIFINREISWLQFNERVLQEAAYPYNPLLERFKFLGIFSNNLDEFFRVRVGTLARMVKYNTKPPEEFLGTSPGKLLNNIYEEVERLNNIFAETYNNLILELKKHKIIFVNEKQLTESQGEWILRYFHNNVRPYLFPILLDNVTNFSMLRDKSIYLAVHMYSPCERKKSKVALIDVPTDKISRFIKLPSSSEFQYVMFLDDVIRFCLKDIFSNFAFEKIEAYTIKFTRDAELDFDNDIAKSFIEVMSESVKMRKHGSPVRFVYDRDIPKYVLNSLMKKMNLSKYDNILEGSRYHNFKDFIDFPNFSDLSSENVRFDSMEPIPHPQLDKYKSIFDAITYKDVLLHFPYQSFQYIIDFLREASIDPKVRSIKMTLYRVASHSNIINALINAARNGKKVTVFLEIQARFDEEANIFWANELHDAGVKVIQGVPGLKVHSKLILVKRLEKNQLALYANVSTGNFHEGTARMYGDDSLITNDRRITLEVDKVFDQLETNFKIQQFGHLMVSPNFLRNRLYLLINKEIKNAKEGKKASITLKLNNLVDPEMVLKLIEANKKGVKISLIIRTNCTVIPGIKRQTENIEAISIVDRLLEHSRVYIFHNGGKEKVYISSADLMTRNLDRRIEVACPIYDEDLKKELMDIINIQLMDNTKARVIAEGRFNEFKKGNSAERHHSQMEIYEYFKKKYMR